MKKISIIVMLFILVACAPKPTSNPVEIQHKLGVTQVNENPSKIVVFDMGILDILDGVNIEVGGLPKASLPQALQRYNDEKYLDAGTLFEPDFDALAIYQPDLIIISGRSSKNFDALSKIAPTVFLGTGTSDDGLMASIEENIKDLKVLFPQTNFDTKLTEVKDALNDLNTKVREMDLSTMFILANSGTISSYGLGSRYDYVFNEIGFKPVSETFENSNHGDKLSFELVAKINPEILIIMDRGAVTGADQLAIELLENEFIQATQAYKNDKVIFVDPHTWYLTEGGLSALLSATKELANGLD